MSKQNLRLETKVGSYWWQCVQDMKQRGAVTFVRGYVRPPDMRYFMDVFTRPEYFEQWAHDNAIRLLGDGMCLTTDDNATLDVVEIDAISVERLELRPAPVTVRGRRFDLYCGNACIATVHQDRSNGQYCMVVCANITKYR